MTPDLTPSRIPAVVDAETERQAAGQLVLVESELRAIEANRVSISKPLNEALREVNSKSKHLAVPLEMVKSDLQHALSQYRCQPEISELISRRDRLEKQFRYAERDGDQRALTELSPAIAEINEKIPKSVKVDGSPLVVRYKRKLVIDAVDEQELADRYFKRVIDEKKIREDLETFSFVASVEHHWEMVPYCVDTGNGETE